MNVKNIFTVICCSLVAATTMGQTKYSNEFLAIGVGARNLGMSKATVASVNDVTAGYWNPAGLTELESDLQVSLMHAEYFAGIAKYDYASIAKTIDSSSTFGLSVIRFGVDDIPNTTELIDAEGNIDYDRITTFSAADYGFLFSYARELGSGLQVGGNAKVIHRQVGDFAKAWGFGLDLSAKYSVNDWKLAVVARDVTSTFNSWSYDLSDAMLATLEATGNVIPRDDVELTLPRLFLGGSRSFDIGEKFNVLGELNLETTFDGKRNTLMKTNLVSMDPNLGLEVGFKRVIFLRTGIGNFQYVQETISREKLTVQPNFGLGLKIKQFHLDYALTNLGNVSVAKVSNIFSLRFDIYAKR